MTVTWALLKYFSIVKSWLSIIITPHFHQYSNFWGQLRKRRYVINNEEMHTKSKTLTYVYKHTWLYRSCCLLCSSANLLSHDARSQVILVLRDSISLSVFVSLLWRAVVCSGLPGMAAILLHSKPEKLSDTHQAEHI